MAGRVPERGYSNWIRGARTDRNWRPPEPSGRRPEKPRTPSLAEEIMKKYRGKKPKDIAERIEIMLTSLQSSRARTMVMFEKEGLLGPAGLAVKRRESLLMQQITETINFLEKRAPKKAQGLRDELQEILGQKN